jgi:hypothetical protein
MFCFNPVKRNNHYLIKEKIYFTPNLSGLKHITLQPMKMDFLSPELSKTGQITP